MSHHHTSLSPSYVVGNVCMSIPSIGIFQILLQNGGHALSKPVRENSILDILAVPGVSSVTRYVKPSLTVKMVIPGLWFMQLLSIPRLFAFAHTDFGIFIN